MIVREISDFLQACSEAYKKKLNGFSEHFLKTENMIKTLGSANKGPFLFTIKTYSQCCRIVNLL